MGHQSLIAAIRDEVIEHSLSEYRGLLESAASTEATDAYWKEVLGLYRRLSPEDRDTLLRVIRQVMVDTVATMLHVLDGAGRLEGFPHDLAITACGRPLSPDLHDAFLAAEEEER